MVRVSAHDWTVVPGWWPAPEASTAQWRFWLAQVAGRHEAMAAIAHASPALAARAARVCRGEAISAQTARRAAEAVARYLLRMRGRATPCGLLAGVAAVQVAASAAVVWGNSHRLHSTPAAHDMATEIAAVENDPALLRELRVQANDLISRRGGRLVVDGMPHLHLDRPAEVSVRASAVVDLVLAEAARPVSVADLVRVIADRFPRTTSDRIEAMLADLVRHGLLISELRVPGTCTNPGADLRDRLGPIRDGAAGASDAPGQRRSRRRRRGPAAP